MDRPVDSKQTSRRWLLGQFVMDRWSCQRVDPALRRHANLGLVGSELCRIELRLHRRHQDNSLVVGHGRSVSWMKIPRPESVQVHLEQPATARSPCERGSTPLRTHYEQPENSLVVTP